MSPVTVTLQLRWADTDHYGHVNNVTYLRYVEEARIRAFGLPDLPATFDPDRPPVLAARDGEVRVLLRRETEDDLLALDVG